MRDADPVEHATADLVRPAELERVEALPVGERTAAYRVLQQRLQEILLAGSG